MSIRRKISIFTTIIIVIMMVCFFLFSKEAFNKQIIDAERSYLSVAMKVIRNEMEHNKSEILQSGQVAAKEITRLGYMDKGSNRANLHRLIDNMHDTHMIVDYLVILDKNKQLIARARPQMVYSNPQWLAQLVDVATKSKTAIASDEAFPLTDFFNEGSSLYNKFVITRANVSKGNKESFTRASAAVVVVPILDDYGEVMGTAILSDIVNNDSYFPERYSESIEGSFLSISIDGVRVCTNITNEAREKGSLGTDIPKNKAVIDSSGLQYFGKEEVFGENHVFLEEKLCNYFGKEIALVGVGMPETRFQSIVKDNSFMVLLMIFVVGVLLIFVSNFVGRIISRPIVEATKQAAKVNKMISGKTTETNLGADEGQVLLDTVEVVKDNLKKWQALKEDYAARLKKEKLQQEKLTNALKRTNARQEKLITDRTTYLKGLVEELRDANKAKALFLGNISHELRTPLNAIIGSAEILKEPMLGPLTTKQLNYVDSIHSSGNHLLQLINDVLDVSKIASGKMPLNMARFYIRDVIEPMVRNIKTTYAKDKNLDIGVVIEPKDTMVVADAQKLRQIMYNLLSNAAKFTPEGGHIEVKASQLTDCLEVQVKDDGIGIAAEDQERVFKEFEQVDNSYTRENSGTGLGLPLVKMLVGLHGGHVTLKSREGKGTELIFTIPNANNEYIEEK